MGRRPKKVAVNGSRRLTVFETLFADRLMVGPSTNKGFFYFFLENMCREPVPGPSAKMFFIFL
jgi:hypothetical protein